VWRLIGYVQEGKRGTENYYCMYYGGCCGGWWQRKNKVQWWIKKVCVGEGGNGGGGVEGFSAGNSGDGFVIKRLWYSLKYDRNMIMAVDRDTNVRMMFKENDEYMYIYM